MRPLARPFRTIGLRSAQALGGLVLAVSVQAGCAQGGDGDWNGGGDQLATSTVATDPNSCVQTECPAPYATCPGVPDPCSVNLRTDNDHCGACDTPCPTTKASAHGEYLCSDGACHLTCSPLHADCNNDPSDGCETSTSKDPKNCGACGNVCANDDPCWKGACGCPNGFTRCGDSCADLKTDNDNCGACSNACGPPKDPNDPKWICGPQVKPEHTQWACGDSACKLSCKPPYANCNQDFCGDGCETDLLSDPQNCGACGQACPAGQFCHQGTCGCPEGTTACHGECVALDRDPLNCGTCGAVCPGKKPAFDGPSTGSPSCTNGECSYTCLPGFADCDGLLFNGCEVDLTSDQKHCGACGTSCNVVQGQPCVAGKCLTKPCIAEPLR